MSTAGTWHWFDNALYPLRPKQNGRHFADDIFIYIIFSWNEIVWIPIRISLKFVPMCPINNIPALVQIMAWRRPGDRPLSEAMMIRLMTHICVTRPQWCLHKMTTISQTKFSNTFFVWKLFYLYENFIDICSLVSSWQYGTIGSDNGLTPKRRQFRIWTNNGVVYWRKNASLDLNEITLRGLECPLFHVLSYSNRTILDQ